jgi:hypothetical protein
MKMITRAFIIAVTITLATSAESADKKPSEKTETQPLTAEDIRNRLEVKGEIFVLDQSGKKLIDAPSGYSNWRGNGTAPLESNWGSRGNYGKIFLHHVWTINPDGTISVLIEEYAREEDDPKTGNFQKFADLLKKSEFTVENFASVTWKIVNIKDKNVVVRLTPNLRVQLKPTDIADLPIAGRDVMITDDKGFLWSQKSSFNGSYVALKTHRGTIAVSFRPFFGAKEIGEAREKEINIKLPNDISVSMRSETAFLPADMGGKIYGLFIPELKSDSPRGTHIWSSSTEEVLLRKLDAAEK